MGEEGVKYLENNIVFGYEKEGLEKCQALQRLLYEVMDQLGEYGSKHDAYRVRVIVEDQSGKKVE